MNRYWATQVQATMNTKIAVDLCLEQLEAEIENFMKSISFDETVRMHFLEQSAKYFGVYVKSKSIDLLDNKKTN